MIPSRNSWKKLILMGEIKRQALGEMARKRIVDHFSLSQIVKSYEEIYQNLIIGIGV